MRILVVGAGGVGSAVAPIAARRSFFERMVVADYDVARAEQVVARLADPRFVAARVDASRPEAVAALCREHAITHVLNAVDPRFVMPIFEGAFAAGRTTWTLRCPCRTRIRSGRTSCPGSSWATSSSRRRERGKRPTGWP